MKQHLHQRRGDASSVDEENRQSGHEQSQNGENRGSKAHSDSYEEEDANLDGINPWHVLPLRTPACILGLGDGDGNVRTAAPASTLLHSSEWRSRGRRVPMIGEAQQHQPLIPHSSSAIGRTQMCEYCGRMYRRSDHLSRHIQSVHLKLRPFECSICLRSFSRRDNLELHFRAKHIVASSSSSSLSSSPEKPDGGMKKPKRH